MKLMLQLKSRSVGVEHDDDLKEEQFQLAKLILGLWKSDRLRYCYDTIWRIAREMPWIIRVNYYRLKKPIEIGKYFTKGHFETVEVEDTVAHECDMNPGQVDKYLMGLDEEVRERLLKDEDEDTRRSLGFSAMSQVCVGVGPNFGDEKWASGLRCFNDSMIGRICFLVTGWARLFRGGW
ncbi:High-affinity methionine permease [Venturia inaequalis]|nr:High-affinity methionine permease [Venturia inaequalis]